ncbi:hypothetical protein H4R33_006143 [Dimargaris cristalligena]|uniref:Lipoprotein n=1 Tax=Dimargaris cristalligena TaxID=215637 RepID=A0A4P9ZT12_9FUNG|nr:hypothetical protein H4R33_006143 [Dimargaris cristalligena]RKP35961.1 hypothetical protein BJ085DRAFT_34272 [Dimargaris cristalligena]|eukprot:RKP35961.1 hypothetical protein BJ085DRAFT_34272 [Dimargaris cristalligena]
MTLALLALTVNTFNACAAPTDDPAGLRDRFPQWCRDKSCQIRDKMGRVKENADNLAHLQSSYRNDYDYYSSADTYFDPEEEERNYQAQKAKENALNGIY